MIERGILFVGAGPHDLGLMAEAVALDHVRQSEAYLPIRFYAASVDEPMGMDPVLLRALKRLELDANGLSPKPLALYALLGAPAIHHVVCLDHAVPHAAVDQFDDETDQQSWRFGRPPAKDAPPGVRYAYYLERAHDIRRRLPAFIKGLSELNSPQIESVAASA